MANWGAFSEAFSNSFNRSQDQKQKQKDKLQEQAFREAALRLQAQLDNQAMTPEQKNAKAFGFEMNPQGLKDFKMSQDPYQQQELALKELDYQMKKPYYEAQAFNLQNPQSDKQKSIEYLMSKGMSLQQATDIVFPKPFNPYSLMGMFGSGNQGGGNFGAP
ncbi:MAG: hypothetical protein AB7O96_01070 [Pseudobdellovibrionaceae bacterium]